MPGSYKDLLASYKAALDPIRRKKLDPNAPGASRGNAIGLAPLVVTAERRPVPGMFSGQERPLFGGTDIVDALDAGRNTPAPSQPVRRRQSLAEGLGETLGNLPSVAGVVAGALLPEPETPEGAEAGRYGRLGRTVGRGLAESGHATVAGAAALGRALGRVPGAAQFPVTSGLVQASRREELQPEALADEREGIRYTYGDPRSGVETAGMVASRLGGDLAQFMAPGAAAGKGIAGAAGGGLRGVARRSAINTAVSAPVTAAQAGERENSATGFLADATENDFLEGLSSSVPGRVAGDIGLDLLAGGAVEGIAGAGRALKGRTAAARAIERQQIVSAGRPVVEPPPVTPESLRASVDEAGTGIMPRNRRSLPDDTPFRRRSMDEATPESKGVGGRWRESPYVEDGKVEEVPISWLRQFREYDRAASDPERVRQIAAEIEERGLDNPLILQIGKRDRMAVLGEGNHRLAALERLGYDTAPVRVWRQQELGRGIRRDDMLPRPDEYFPADAPPSSVFPERRISEPPQSVLGSADPPTPTPALREPPAAASGAAGARSASLTDRLLSPLQNEIGSTSPDEVRRAMRREEVPAAFGGGVPMDLRKNPSLQRAWIYGMEAGQEGVERGMLATKYEEGSKEWRAAQRGWNSTRPREPRVQAAPESGGRFVVQPSTRGRFQIVDTESGRVAEEVGGIGAERTARALASRLERESVTAAPEAGVLAGTRVVDESGVPKVAYHGTSRAFEEFDPAQVNAGSQYGPGYYFTENPAVAGDAGQGLAEQAPLGYATPPERVRKMYDRIAELRAETEEVVATLRRAEEEGDSAKAGMFRDWLDGNQREIAELDGLVAESGVAPNVRPARLGIRNPFDIDATYSPEEVMELVRASGAAPETIEAVAEGLPLTAREGRIHGDDVYSRVLLSWTHPGDGRAVNETLRRAGYDGITHIGGGNTGTDPHRVWIAFDREQIRSAFGPPESAAQTGAANLRPMTALAGAGGGAAYGAAEDDENPLRGALLGGAAGLVGGAALPGALRSAGRIAGDEIGAVMPDPERLLFDALNRRGAQVRPADLAALASGEMDPADFSRAYGVAPAIARKYANAAQTISDPAGYRSPLDSEEFAYDPPERGDLFGPAPEPRPIEGEPDDSFLPPDPKYGSGGGQEGLPTFSPEGIATARKSVMLGNIAGRLRDYFGTGLVFQGSETLSEIPATVLDAVIDRMPGMRGQRTKSFNLGATATAAWKGVTEGNRDMVRAIVGKPRLSRAGQAAEEAASTAVEGADRVVMADPGLDALVRVTGRFAGSVDTPSAVYAYEKSLAEQARTIVLNERLKGQRLSRAEAKERIAQLTAEPTDEMKALAVAALAHATFTNESVASRLANSLREGTFPDATKGREDMPWVRAGLDFAIPYRHVPGASAGKQLEYSPLGAVKVGRDAVRLFRLARGENPDPATIADVRRGLSMTAGRVVTGAAAIWLGSELAADGLMTGTHVPPELKDDGAIPMSIKIAGRWWPLGMMPPVGPLMAVGAEFHARGAVESAMTLGQSVTDATLMRGMGDVRSAVTRPDKAESYGESAASSFIPPVVGQVARIIDPVRRDPEGPLEAVANRIPGLSQTVDPRTSRSGEEQRETASLPGRIGLSLLDGLRSVPDRTGDDPLVDSLRTTDFRVPGMSQRAAETQEQFTRRLTATPQAPRLEGESDADYARRNERWRQIRPAETEEEYRGRQREIQAVTDSVLRQIMLSPERPEGELGDLWEDYRKMEEYAREAVRDRPQDYGGLDPAAMAREQRKALLNRVVNQIRADWRRANPF